MSFFGESTLGTSVEVQAVPCYISNYHEAVLAVVAESESNFNALMTTIGLHENKALRESGECALNEGAIRSFWEKVKKFFMSILAKLKGIFNSFMSRVDAQFKGGKSFFDKYKKELAEKFSKIDKDKVKFHGYKFTHLDSKNSMNKEGIANTVAAMFSVSAQSLDFSATDAQKIIDGREKLDDKIEGFRSACLGETSGSYSASEYNKALFEHFRDGQSTKSEVDGVDFAYLAKVLGNDKAAKDASDSYKQLEKDINEIIKLTEKAQNTSITAQTKDPKDGDAGKRTAAYPVIVSAFKGCLAAKQAYLGAQVTAISNEISQAKGFASQVIRASVKESASWQSYGGSSEDIFGSVEFR